MVIFSNGCIIASHDSVIAAAGICCWRASICHNPTLAWNAPKALARSVIFFVCSTASATLTNRMMASSFKSGNSENTGYQSSNFKYAAARNLTVEGARGLCAVRRRSNSLRLRYRLKRLLSSSLRESALITSSNWSG